jgi:5-methyltetrahydrofolate corrinoid/iron sulfur protein methyltransferase
VIIIGEKINASIPKSKIIIQERDEKKLLELAGGQVDAGADFIDVNVGTGIGSREDEINSMEWAITTIQQELDIPLCIDSADHVVLEAGIKARDGRPSIINSVKAEEENLEQVMPLAGAYNLPIVALAMDETGIPMSVEGRMRACERIATTCKKYDVPLESVFFDPLVLPVGTDIKQGAVTLHTIMEIKRNFPTAKTVMGLSNVSYGLPARARLNVAFLHMAIFAGLDAAITDPLNKDLMDAVKTAEVLAGKDRHCRRYTRAFRN